MSEDAASVDGQQAMDLEQRLQSAQQEAAHNHDKYLRALADSENMRKRLDRLCEERIWQEKRRLLTHLLELGDQLREALQYAGADDALGAGVRLTYEQLARTLDLEGVQALEAVGKSFDPSFHEAVELAQRGTTRPDQITFEYRKGYLLDGKLLRAARVQVAREE